jgi:hypothetical protein
MWRGLYADPDGICRADRVPEQIWSAACALMAEVDRHNNAERDAIRDRAERQEIERITAAATLLQRQPRFARSVGEPEDL